MTKNTNDPQTLLQEIQELKMRQDEILEILDVLLISLEDVDNNPKEPEFWQALRLMTDYTI